MSEKRFGIFRRRKTKDAPSGLVTTSPVLTEALRLWDGTLAGYGTIYRKLAPVRTVVDFLADAVSTTPLKVYRRAESGRPEAREHPLALLLDNPNPELTTRRLIWGTVADVAVYGNAYWRKVEQGRKRYLVPLPPFRVTPKGGDLLSPAAYEFWPVNGGAPELFPRDEIVHFRTYDPEDRRVGSSKLEALRNILLEEVEASKSRRGYWQNRASVEGVLKHPEHLSMEAQERLRAQFDNRYAGSENAGRTMILEEGMDWQATAFSPKDSEFVQGREFVLEATARVYNIPLSLLGLTQTATYASQREFRKQLYTEVLPPWFELIQSEVELQLLPWFTQIQDIYCEFLAEAHLRGDFDAQGALVFQATGRPYMTVTEARKLFNMDIRNEETDDELAVPVGPNFALESAAEEAALQPATVTALPSARAADALGAFFDRQERSIRARLGAGGAFDHDRWNRELGAVLKNRAVAERVNLEIAAQLAAGQDPGVVFDRLRLRAPLLALEA